MILQSTFFSFNGIFYKQTFETPMGSPLSLILANIVLEDLEEQALERLSIRLPISYRYVDDILLAASYEGLNDILMIFNSLHTVCNLPWKLVIAIPLVFWM